MDIEEKYKRHLELCNLLHDTYIKKNQAYGDAFGKTFCDLGLISAITRMYDKFNRIMTLSKGVENKVIDESLKDTLLDLANYAIMTYLEIENNNG